MAQLLALAMHESHSDKGGTSRLPTNLPQMWTAANCHQFCFAFSVGVVGKAAGKGDKQTQQVKRKDEQGAEFL